MRDVKAQVCHLKYRISCYVIPSCTSVSDPLPIWTITIYECLSTMQKLHTLEFKAPFVQIRVVSWISSQTLPALMCLYTQDGNSDQKTQWTALFSQNYQEEITAANCCNALRCFVGSVGRSDVHAILHISSGRQTVAANVEYCFHSYYIPLVFVNYSMPEKYQYSLLFGFPSKTGSSSVNAFHLM